MNGFGLRRDVLTYRLTYTELRKYMVELSGNSISIYRREGGREAGRDREELRGRDQGTGRQAITEVDRQAGRQAGKVGGRQAGRQAALLGLVQCSSNL